MRVVAERRLAIVLGALAGTPRVVVGGNFAVPALLSEALPPDVVLVQTSAPSHGTVSLGTEVNVLPAAIEAARSRVAIV